MIRVPEHKTARRSTNIRTVEEQRDMFSAGVFASHFKAVCHRSCADLAALAAEVDALLHSLHHAVVTVFVVRIV